MKCASFAAILVLVAAAPALAWNDRGHMLTAMVAYQDLKPEVRDRVNAILKDHPQRDLLAAGGPDDGPDRDMWIFAKASTWPDMVRNKTNELSATEHHAQWHYINIPVALDGMNMPTPPMQWDGHNDPQNIVQAVEKVTTEIKAPATAPDRRAMSLCWIEHLVGDIHQPLHAVSLFSKQFPKGDRGGNSFAVRRGDTPTKLHTYWDNLMGAGTSWPTLQKQVEGFKADPAMSRAALGIPASVLDMKAWAEESAKIAKASVYCNGAIKGSPHESGDYPKDTPVLPPDYERTVKQVAAKRVVLAGYRMADALNTALAPARATAIPAEREVPQTVP